MPTDNFYFIGGEPVSIQSQASNARPPATGHPAASVGVGDLLTISFGTTVAMWAVGYVGHMPLTRLPPIVFVSVMLVCLIAGGWVAGRHTARGIRGGAWVGLISAALNLLILGSLLARPQSGQVAEGAWLWLPVWFALSTGLAVIGAAVGRASSGLRQPEINWAAGLAWITCLAVLLLIIAGGLVTGFRAGMAVPDWPNTFGTNLFLYPLARMTGGVFFEHAHRLLGTLVGCATLVLAIYGTATRRRRRPLVALLWTALTAVVLQGVIGGLRVTADNHLLAVIHGFFAHVVFGSLIAAAVMLSRDWPDRIGAECRFSAGTDRFFTTLLVACVLLQTLLGTLVRQLDTGLLAHITVAALVALVALAAGVRAWGSNPNRTVLRRGGAMLLLLVLVQLTLGIVALIFRTPPVDASPSAQMLAATAGQLPVAPLPAVITTAHQTNAAVILAVVVVLVMWTWRLLVPPSAVTLGSGPAVAANQ